MTHPTTSIIRDSVVAGLSVARTAASDSVPPSMALGASRLPSAMKASSNWMFRRLSLTSHTAYSLRDHSCLSPRTLNLTCMFEP